MGRSIFSTKSLASLQEDNAAHKGPPRSLSALHLTLLGVGCIMGTGVFVLTGHVAANNAGPAVTLSFAIAAFVAALGALCYAEMAAMIPVAGSSYTYAYATMGELAAFAIGWDMGLQWLVGAAAVSVGWSGYVCAFITHISGIVVPASLRSAPWAWDAAENQFVPTGAYVNLPAIILIAGVACVLVRGAQQSARLNAIVVALKMAAVLMFLAFASRFVNQENWQPFVPPNTGVFGEFGVSGVLQGATLLFFAYLGFEAVSVAAPETKNPRRDVPIGIMASLTICATLYVAVAATLTGIVPYQKLGVPYPMAIGVAATGIGWLETLVEVGAIAGLTSVTLVQLYAQPRVLHAMAVDGFLPAAFTHMHPKRHTPTRLIWTSSTLAAIGGGFMPIGALAELTSLQTLFAFMLVAAGVIMLRLQKPDAPRKFKVPGGTWLVPGLSIASCLVLMYTASSASFLRLAVWMAIGFAIYAFYGRANVARVEARIANSEGVALEASPLLGE